jgi:fatty-acyl-CoA synthase
MTGPAASPSPSTATRSRMAGEASLDYLEVPTLGDLLVRACSAHPDARALTIAADRLTYAELLDRSVFAARGLAALGITPGKRVGIYTPNCAAFVEFFFATAMLGGVVVPLNNRFRARELLHVQVDADLSVIVTSGASSEFADHSGRMRRLLQELGPGVRRPTVVVADEPFSADGLMGRDELRERAKSVAVEAIEKARADVRLRDLAAILYTSGTTALPKGCLHTHEALVRNGIVTGRSRFLLTGHDRFWDPLPMFHVSFLTPMIACMDVGAEILAMTRFDPEAGLDLIEKERATWLFAAFQVVARGLIDAASFANRPVDSVRMTMCIGHTADLRRFQAAFPGAQLLSTYGSTETGGVITYHEPSATPEQRVTTCGTPFRGVRLAIKDTESPALLATGQIGEILVRGYSVLDGYVNDRAATAAALDDDRWLHTGDLGALDENGHLIFHGRLKDMIKVGGENVSAVEVEAVLAEHPSVVSAQVVGAPDPRLDEVVAAFVEIAPGKDTSARDLAEYCTDRIASYKVPRHFRFVTAWPMSATKVRKEALRQQIAAELADEREEIRP